MSVTHNLIARAMQLVAGRFAGPIPELRFTDLPGHTRTLTVPTDSGSVPCTVYEPRPEPGTQPPPVFLNLHGGGFVLRHPEQDDHICRYLAANAGCVVVNADYTTAPQRTFPTAPRQAYGVWQWLVANSAAQGWDGTRLAVGGHSAGGNLAAGVARQARDHGTFAPLLQILDYPATDLAKDPAAKRTRTAKPVISARSAGMFTEVYVPRPADRLDPLASPVLADDLEGLAPALVITAELDSLRDEADDFAQALAAAGVPVTHRVMEGVDHVFTHQGPVDAAKEAIELMAQSLRDVFSDQRR
ncbi:alpha/beta hydrolase [Streptomyces sp. NPDC006175]|uniref:alpha/beta hydrolase n=1 Tax=unclassified Streptomyces TaxID=2593676 RepID=UPI0033A647CC